VGDPFAGALCRDLDPDLWFPEYGNRRAIDISCQVAVCGRCPVRVACLDLAVKTGVSDGIWGGVLFTDWRRAHRKKITCQDA
jgi:WhiB family redox-sensing transcriptional regulator